MEQSALCEKLTRSKLLKKYPAFHGTLRFITVFTRARYLSLSWARSIQCMPSYPSSRRSILILPFHLLPSGLLPSGFPTKILYALSLPHTCYMSCLFDLLDLITWMIFSEEYRAWSTSLCSLLHSHVTSSILGPNILPPQHPILENPQPNFFTKQS